MPIASFAYIIHSEFPEPQMYNIKEIEDNKTLSAMMWNPDRILHSLFELRNKGFISKISEIDNYRQFTIKWNLKQVVERLIAADKQN